MAVRYVRSTDGSNADDGTTWALAKADLAGVSAIDTAGDTIWVSDNHAETTNSPTFAGAGTNASPTRLLCGDDAAEPPTALATTATVTPGSGSITFNGSLYCYGITFITAQGMLLARSAGDHQTFENCPMHFTGANSQVGPSGTANVSTDVKFINCNLKPLSNTSSFGVSGKFEIRGGAMVSGGSTNTNGYFARAGDRTHTDILIDGFDFSAVGATMSLFITDTAGNIKATIRNCKMPASWSGSLVTGTIGVGQSFELYNCDSADTNYRLWCQYYEGDVKSETTIVMTGGATDGTTPIALKMSTTANASYPSVTLRSPEIFKRNETTGSSKTVTVEFVHDTNVAAGQGAGTANAFRDDEVWLEVQYLGTSGAPLATLITDTISVVATPADQASSSVTWTTTGMTTPVKQALSVTFTPQEKGMIIGRVCVGKASKTIYINPDLIVS